MKHLCLLFAILSFLDCKAQKGHEDFAKEVIISGRVFNREVYPKEKEVKLEIPYLSGLETVYTSPIADDGTFCFRFSSYASIMRNTCMYTRVIVCMLRLTSTICCIPALPGLPVR